MIKKLALATILSISALAQTCTYSIEKDSLNFKWTAFKYDTKAGVSGTFDKYELKFKDSDTVEGLLNSAKIEIDTKSVNTKNPARDKTLFNNFFALSKENKIEVKVKNSMIGKEIALVNTEITMNKNNQNVPFNATLKDDNLNAKAKIDMLNFALSGALKSINKACYDLHKGITWSDVDLEFNFKIKKSCK